MPKVSAKFGFYAILTNPVIGYEPLAKVLVEEAVPFIQLRIKNDNRENTLRIAKRISAICFGTQTKFIINDDPLLVVESGADGVHLGQDDMPYEQARMILGPNRIIGLSTHNPDQVREANELKPDYIGIGPVYETPTKQIADPVLGLSGLKEMLALTNLPSIAIGGIDFSNIEDVMIAGAKNVCAVRLINESKEPHKVLSQLKQLFLN
ncbi:MAG: thiamine-phosphate diphosphorylase [Candidatus Margulisbacteria bacterium GWF2_35_9]|nr:MAG: thiamine-phosphate diphosphorylase [Candidatus Margulisbacteria bacterium GWF2_35_9]